MGLLIGSDGKKIRLSGSFGTPTYSCNNLRGIVQLVNKLKNKYDEENPKYKKDNKPL